mgnify:CR=1 FL=1
MDAGHRWRPPKLMTIGACLVVAAAAISTSSATATLTDKTKPKPGSSCAHPLESGIVGDGAKAGDTKDISVNRKDVTMPSGAGSSPEPTVFELEVTVRNPRIVICGASVTHITINLTTGQREKHIYHPAIGPHGGLSSPVAYIRDRSNYAEYMEVFARLVSARSAVGKAVPAESAGKTPKPGSSCTHPLESRLTSRAQVGDATGDYSIEVVGYEPNIPLGGFQRLRVRVSVHNAHVVLCPVIKILDTVTTSEEANANPAKYGTPHYYHVSIAPGGGLSSAVTLPEGDFTPIRVYARLK